MKKYIVLGVLASLLFITPVSAATIQELQAQLNTLMAQFAQLQQQQAAQLQNTNASPNTSASNDCDVNKMTRVLTIGSRGKDVLCLQEYLIEEGYLEVSATSYFGSATRAAVQNWQRDNGVSAVGTFGPASRAVYARLIANASSGSQDDSAVTPPTSASASVIIDQAALMTSSARPTLSGSAYNVVQPFGISISDSGGKVWGSGNVTVTNNRWSTTVNQSLAAGTYQVQVYSNNKLVTTGTLTVTSSTSIIPPMPGEGAPVITSLSSYSGTVGDTLYVYGSNFGQAPVVIFDGNSSNSRTVSLVASVCTQNIGNNTCSGWYFQIPESLTAGGHAVQVAQHEKAARSNGVGITVIAQTQPGKTLRITNPDGKTIWTAGEVRTFTWTSTGLEGTTGYIDLSCNEASYRIAENIPNTGSYIWKNVGTMPSGALIPYGACSPKIIMGGYGDIGDTLTISNAPSSFTLTSPARNTTWNIGDTQYIKWSSVGIRSGATAYLDLVGGGVTYQIGVIYSLGDTGTHVYTVGKMYSGGSIPAGTYTLKMTVVDGLSRIGDAVDQITIVQQEPLPLPYGSVTLNYPTGGETFIKGTPYTIRWVSSNLGSYTIDLSLTNAFGQSIINIANNIPNTGNYTWVPSTSIPDASYNMLIATHDNGRTAQYLSRGSFNVLSQAQTQSSITVTSPVVGQIINMGEGSGTFMIHWTDSRQKGASQSYVILLANNNFNGGKGYIAYGVSATAAGCAIVGSTCTYEWTPTQPASQNTIYVYDSANDPNGTIMGQSGLFSVAASTTAGPSCTLATDKSSYQYGDTINLSWSSKNATYASFQQDTSGKDALWVPGDKLWTSGTQPIKATVTGNPVVTMLIYNYTGKDSCSITIPIAAPTSAPMDSISANSAFSNPVYNVGETNKKIASFQITASTAQAVSIGSLTFAKNGNLGLELQNMKVVVNGSSFGTNRPVIAGAETFTNANPFTVPAGGSVVADVYADILSSSMSGTYQSAISVTGWSAAGSISGSMIPFPGTVNGQTIIVNGLTTTPVQTPPTIVMNSGFNNPTYHAGDTNKKIASFEFRAPANNNMTYGTFGLKNNSSVVGLQNLKVMIGGTQIGQTQAVVTQGALMNFQSYYATTVPAGGAVYVDVYADILSSVPADVYSGVISMNFVSANYVSPWGTYSLPSPVVGQDITIQ